MRISDIRGIGLLATQATTGVTRIVEGVHRSVWDTIGIPGGDAPGRTRGITGLVYNTVHGVTMLVGQGVDSGLARLAPLLEPTEATRPGTPQREALLAALNGVIGDRLVDSDNPLAIPMSLRYRFAAMNGSDPAPMPEASGKVLVLIHGLCLNDLQGYAQHSSARRRPDGERRVDHGEALASALGYTPVYLRYNSGLHTSQNGRELSAQLERLVRHWPTPVEELTVVAHSMGGLLIRGAFHYGQQDALYWTGKLDNIVFLGTPHHGAPLERAGNWVDVILGSTPYTAPFTRLGQLRSAGITDLRHGHVLDEDWHGHDRFQRRPDSRQVVPLPEGVACYTVAATTTAERGLLANRVIGDGLVPVRSALGQHDDARRNLAFAQESQRIVCGMNHLELLSSPEVTEQMVQWLTPSRTEFAVSPIRSQSR